MRNYDQSLSRLNPDLLRGFRRRRRSLLQAVWDFCWTLIDVRALGDVY